MERLTFRLRVEYVFVFIVVFALFSLYHVQTWVQLNPNPWGKDVLLDWGRKGVELIKNADKTAGNNDTSISFDDNEETLEDQEDLLSHQPAVAPHQGTHYSAQPNSEEIKELIKEKKAAWAEANKNFPPPAENCKHTINRDYKAHPVVFSGQADMPDCDIPCVGNGDPDIGYHGCKHVKSFERTMENRGRWRGDNNHIAGNSRLDSDVIIQYFSWAEYQFMDPPKPKTQSAAMAAFVSNCGPQYRLQVLKTIINSGLRVDSMGSCMNNKQSVAKDNGSGRLESKIDAVAGYKFTFAFENSETDDYVSEKLWGPLAAGSIPIYHGAPNAKKFAPSNRSVIFASDFKDAEELAAYLNLLDSNDTLYNEYLQWKFDGPTKEWVALMDISILHSNCRFCIRSADIDRKTVGEVVTGPFQEENEEEMKIYEGAVALMLKVRERGKFWLRRIHLEQLTLKELYQKIYDKWNDPEKGKILGVYRLWDNTRTYLEMDEEVVELDEATELEIVFENPGSKDRYSYTTWWYKKYKNQILG